MAMSTPRSFESSVRIHAERPSVSTQCSKYRSTKSLDSVVPEGQKLSSSEVRHTFAGLDSMHFTPASRCWTEGLELRQGGVPPLVMNDSLCHNRSELQQLQSVTRHQRKEEGFGEQQQQGEVDMPLSSILPLIPHPDLQMKSPPLLKKPKAQEGDGSLEDLQSPSQEKKKKRKKPSKRKEKISAKNEEDERRVTTILSESKSGRCRQNDTEVGPLGDEVSKRKSHSQSSISSVTMEETRCKLYEKERVAKAFEKEQNNVIDSMPGENESIATMPPSRNVNGDDVVHHAMLLKGRKSRHWPVIPLSTPPNNDVSSESEHQEDNLDHLRSVPRTDKEGSFHTASTKQKIIPMYLPFEDIRRNDDEDTVERTPCLQKNDIVTHNEEQLMAIFTTPSLDQIAPSARITNEEKQKVALCNMSKCINVTSGKSSDGDDSVSRSCSCSTATSLTETDMVRDEEFWWRWSSECESKSSHIQKYRGASSANTSSKGLRCDTSVETDEAQRRCVMGTQSRYQKADSGEVGSPTYSHDIKVQPKTKEKDSKCELAHHSSALEKRNVPYLNGETGKHDPTGEQQPPTSSDVAPGSRCHHPLLAVESNVKMLQQRALTGRSGSRGALHENEGALFTLLQGRLTPNDPSKKFRKTINSLPHFEEVHPRRSVEREDRLRSLAWAGLEEYAACRRRIRTVSAQKALRFGNYSPYGALVWITHSIYPPGTTSSTKRAARVAPPPMASPFLCNPHLNRNSGGWHTEIARPNVERSGHRRREILHHIQKAILKAEYTSLTLEDENDQTENLIWPSSPSFPLFCQEIELSPASSYGDMFERQEGGKKIVRNANFEQQVHMHQGNEHKQSIHAKLRLSPQEAKRLRERTEVDLHTLMTPDVKEESDQTWLESLECLGQEERVAIHSFLRSSSENWLDSIGQWAQTAEYTTKAQIEDKNASEKLRHTSVAPGVKASVFDEILSESERAEIEEALLFEQTASKKSPWGSQKPSRHLSKLKRHRRESPAHLSRCGSWQEHANMNACSTAHGDTSSQHSQGRNHQLTPNSHQGFQLASRFLPPITLEYMSYNAMVPQASRGFQKGISQMPSFQRDNVQGFDYRREIQGFHKAPHRHHPTLLVQVPFPTADQKRTLGPRMYQSSCLQSEGRVQETNCSIRTGQDRNGRPFDSKSNMTAQSSSQSSSFGRHSRSPLALSPSEDQVRTAKQERIWSGNADAHSPRLHHGLCNSLSNAVLAPNAAKMPSLPHAYIHPDRHQSSHHHRLPITRANRSTVGHLGPFHRAESASQKAERPSLTIEDVYAGIAAGGPPGANLTTFSSEASLSMGTSPFETFLMAEMALHCASKAKLGLSSTDNQWLTTNGVPARTEIRLASPSSLPESTSGRLFPHWRDRRHGGAVARSKRGDYERRGAVSAPRVGPVEAHSTSSNAPSGDKERTRASPSIRAHRLSHRPRSQVARSANGPSQSLSLPGVVTRKQGSGLQQHQEACNSIQAQSDSRRHSILSIRSKASWFSDGAKNTVKDNDSHLRKRKSNRSPPGQQ